jgi:hypothetical protein
MTTLRPLPAAAAFLAAQPGQPDLALSIHHAGPSGWCAGCFGEHRQKWPCLVAGLALEVRARQESTGRRLHVAAERPAGLPGCPGNPTAAEGVQDAGAGEAS